METGDHLLCPSHRCKPGSKLLGVRQEDGTVAILPEPLAIDDHFMEQVSKSPMAPEERFRFTNKCIEGGCEQWTGKACGVAERVMEHIQLAADRSLPRCGIRKNCRWFHQQGADACRICPLVITEIPQ